jgi:hypothetical protein
MHRAQHTGSEIVATAERVDPGSRADVARHRVDREVAALEVVAHGQARIGLDAEVGVRVAGVARFTRSDRGLPPRRDDLDALLGTEGRTEAHPDETPCDAQLLCRAVAAQDRDQLGDAVPPHEEVDVLHLTSQQPVAQAAAHLVDLVERERAHALEHALAQGIEDRFGRHRDRLPTAVRPPERAQRRTTRP